VALSCSKANVDTWPTVGPINVVIQSLPLLWPFTNYTTYFVVKNKCVLVGCLVLGEFYIALKNGTQESYFRDKIETSCLRCLIVSSDRRKLAGLCTVLPSRKKALLILLYVVSAKYKLNIWQHCKLCLSVRQAVTHPPSCLNLTAAL
jgi:hypothetical protein